jgi:hypothetical protein
VSSLSEINEIPSKKPHAHILSFANIFIQAQVRMRLHIEYVKNGLCECVFKRVTT